MHAAQGVKVAVLDTGVEPEHPDLVGKVTGFVEFDAKGKVVRDGVKERGMLTAMAHMSAARSSVAAPASAG